MDYNLAIASLMKVEGTSDAIKVIEENVKILQEKAKQAEILEANVAKILAENNLEGSDLKTELETLSVKNKTITRELEEYKNEINTIKEQNAIMQKRINVDKIANKYSANADVIERLIGNEEISWNNEVALISGKVFDEYVEQNLAAFKPSIYMQKTEKVESVEKLNEPPKLGSGSAKSKTEEDKVANYIKNLYKMPEHLLRR